MAPLVTWTLIQLAILLLNAVNCRDFDPENRRPGPNEPLLQRLGFQEFKDLYFNRKMHRIFHTGPYLQKNFYFPAKQIEGFNKLVAMGSLKFDWIILHGLGDPYNLAKDWRKNGEDSSVFGDLKKLATRWWGVFKLKIESFEAGVSWRDTKGGQKSCRLIGLSDCQLGGTSSDKQNEIKIEYDSALIHHPFRQTHLNEWRELDIEQTLQFKTYLEPNCGGLSKEEKANITAGIDHLFMSREIRQLIVFELREEYRDWTVELVRRWWRTQK